MKRRKTFSAMTLKGRDTLLNFLYNFFLLLSMSIPFPMNVKLLTLYFSFHISWSKRKRKEKNNFLENKIISCIPHSVNSTIIYLPFGLNSHVLCMFSIAPWSTTHCEYCLLKHLITGFWTLEFNNALCFQWELNNQFLPIIAYSGN